MNDKWVYFFEKWMIYGEFKKVERIYGAKKTIVKSIWWKKRKKKMLKVNLEGGSHKKIPRNLTIIIQYKNLIYNEHFK